MCWWVRPSGAPRPATCEKARLLHRPDQRSAGHALECHAEREPQVLSATARVPALWLMPGRSHGWRSPRRHSGAGPAQRAEFDAVTTLSICDGRSGRDPAVAGRADLSITCELRRCRELSFYRTRQVRQCYKRRSQPERRADRSTTPRARLPCGVPGSGHAA